MSTLCTPRTPLAVEFRCIDLGKDLGDLLRIEGEQARDDRWWAQDFQVALEFDEAKTWAAVHGLSIAGFALYEIHRHVQPWRGYITRILVRQSNRRQRVGTKLLERTFIELREQGISQVFIQVNEHNQGGQLFLERSHGLVQTETIPLESELGGAAHVYCKELST